MTPRPREFDPDEALDGALTVFWRKGYEATSVQDLLDEMGINRFSLYETFGGKRKLFQAAFRRYQGRTEETLFRVLLESEEGLASIKAAFDCLVETVAGSRGKGCLVTNSIIELAPHDAGFRKVLSKHMGRLEDAFYTALKRARKAGEIPAGTSLRQKARLLTALTQGIVVLGKVHGDRTALQATARTCLETLV